MEYLAVHEVPCAGLPCFFFLDRLPPAACPPMFRDAFISSVFLHTTLTWQPFPVNPYSSSCVAAKMPSGITTPAYLDYASFLSC